MSETPDSKESSDEVFSDLTLYLKDFETAYKTIKKDDRLLRERFANVVKKLSKMNHKQMQTYQFDPEDFDLNKILTFMQNRNLESGLKTKEAELVFQDLTIIGKNTSASFAKDVSDVFFAPVTYYKNRKKLANSPIDLKSMPQTRKIVKNATGYASPGTMTLVLGRPGSGCSSLLKVISGQTKTYLDVQGDVTYSGIPSDKMFKDHIQELIYNPELDVHFPYLTVEETMNFAIGCKTPSIRIDNVSRREYQNTIKDLYLTLFGLKSVEKSLVGNDFVRGISGGQRKRVSIAEAMVTNGTLYCFDNATRGLDSSTALEFIEALRTSTNVTQTTSLVTIYQASESIYELFDCVTVLYLGRQIYFGPIDKASEYFETMGFIRSSTDTTPEFLTGVTDPLARKSKPGFTVPQTPDEFEMIWKSSEEYKQLEITIQNKVSIVKADETSELFKQVNKMEKQKYALLKSPYTVNFHEQLKLCCTRRARNIINDKPYTVILVASAVIQSLIVGSMFYNTSSSTIGAFSRGGVIFFSTMYFCIMCLAETSALFEDKPILNKQYGYSMYRPSAELLAKQIVSFPVRLLGIICFTIIIYFLSNMKREAGPFFIFFLFVNLVVIAINALFTLLASFMPTLALANAINGIAMLACVMYSSYMIQKPSMHWWFKWYAYVNPVLYAFGSMISTEFHATSMPCTPSMLIPNGPSYANITEVNQVCAFVGAAQTRKITGQNDVSGDVYVNLAFQFSFSQCWRNLGIMFGFIVGYIVINCLVVEFYNPISASSDKLIFVKGANIPQSLFDATLDKSDDLETGLQVTEKKSAEAINDAIDESKRTDVDTNDEHLGSNDIFMWRNLTHTIIYDGNERKLLDNVQGYVPPGTITALMGESGAGKTTLLNALSRRSDFGVITGDMLINGKNVDASFERRTGYVQQQDLHIPELTVRESLIFSARLRRPFIVPDEEKIEYVDKIIEILKMDEYADCIAGEAGYGLNVEQRKKLSIATELVAKPTLLLFLDEPTSGLDSQSSWSIVQVMKELAKAGQAILCTIHQPSASLFEQFDRLLLLRKGGQTTYFGDIGERSRTLIDYFESQGARTCFEKDNPAEYILDILTTKPPNGENNWAEVWSNSKACELVTKEVDELIERTSKLPESDNSDLSSEFATPYYYQLKLVCGRTQLQFYRSLPYICSKAGLFLIAGLVTGFTFWNSDSSIVGMQNVMFACFQAVLVSNPLTLQIQGRAIGSRELFEVRESKSNTFHWSCLMIAQYLNEIPYSIVFSTVYFVCWYFPIQLDNSPHICGFWWFSYCFFYQLYYTSLSLGIVYAAPDLPSANVIMSLLFNFTIAFTGVCQSPYLMPKFWKFMWRVSPLTYFLNNLLSLVLHERVVECSQYEYNYVNPPENLTCGQFLNDYFETNSGYVANPSEYSNCAVCQYRVGDEFLESVGMSYSYCWRNVGLFCVYIVFNAVAMVGMYYLLRIRKLRLTKEYIKKIGKFKYRAWQ